MATQTDGRGEFSFPVVAARSYRIVAYGEEGHTVEIELQAQVSARPRLVDDAAASGPALWPPPAWAVIGGLLLVSLTLPVLQRKRRSAAAA